MPTRDSFATYNSMTPNDIANSIYAMHGGITNNSGPADDYAATICLTDLSSGSQFNAIITTSPSDGVIRTDRVMSNIFMYMDGLGGFNQYMSGSCNLRLTYTEV